jgi:hypothetical protein
VISFDRVGVEIYIRPGRGLDAIPTNDGLTLVLVGWPVVERDANRADIEGNFFKTLDPIRTRSGMRRSVPSRWPGAPWRRRLRAADGRLPAHAG